jgi:lipopolysaccharide/colanic/teichoic acid biosynthesis glycosyltransferase/glycosyltransferase involved in cell wall biosynthesis
MSQPVAIVHDWLTTMRGGERVLEAICNVFPGADLFTLTWDPNRLSPALAARGATTSAIHRIARAPLVGGRFRGMLPLFPLAVESFNLDAYALVVSSSHCVALGAIASPAAVHVAYVHSPLRYVREAQATYEASVPGGPLGRALFRGAACYLRRWETNAAARPHALIANSTYTRDRILRYYGRSSQVIEPPIETERFERASAGIAGPASAAPFLMVSALVPSKRVDLALRAFQGRSERLVVIGEGPERARLEGLAGPNVTFVPRVTDAELAAHFAGCQALLHTGIDDFGMVMVEAMAAGRPVLACSQGGALEVVRDGETGLLIAPTEDSVRAALDRFARCRGSFDGEVLRNFAKRFDRRHFERRFADAVEEACREHRDTRAAGNNGVGRPRPPICAELPAAGGGAEVRRTACNGTRPTVHANDRPSPGALAVKRGVDVALAATGLVLAAPLMAALGAWVCLDSHGPALFCQSRIGLGRRPFRLVKLRTMDHLGRVTRAGRFLRPLGLDELPQLWNVVRGDMSLIGPRPDVPERVMVFESTIPRYDDRHRMRPGITGLAQVNGTRGDASPMAERVRYDVEYVREWSLAMDGRVLLRTVPAVVADTLFELGK